VVELGSGSISYRRKSIAEWCIDRSSKKCSKREGYPKGYQKNIPDVERGVVEYWDRKNRYT